MRRKAHTAIFLAAPLAITLAAAVAQEPDAAKLAAKFEVAAIKPSDPASKGFRIQSAPGGKFIATGLTVKFLIQQAYGVREFQVIGAPGWTDNERFDITAQPDAEDAAQQNVNPFRMRNLLAERFQLKLTKETREMPVYHLVAAKSGPKLTESTVGPEGQFMQMGRGRITGKGISTAMLAVQLSQQIGRTVINKTNLTKAYDLTLNWTPDVPAGPDGPKDPPGADPNGPTLFTALQEQLGLKLESAKGPVEVLVISSVERPSAN